MGDITKIKDVPSTVTIAIESIRRFSKYLVIPTAVTTFLPDNWLAHMRLLSIKGSPIGIWISVIFWVSLSIVVIDLLQRVIEMISSTMNCLKNTQRIISFY
ncbi:hypothetical protein SAMN02745116_01691 [Pilibacter termitis]|uniref:Uncharacterized protein n=1 Tax=Pilibacter termitis TaxID=263852 RepID=A0A1T4P7Y1_9ENTE|nr:hypothetical protein [Pilibacter termitis]SJZ87690.1 hypothetical protein SAMN02745116_01691 [Pilibacter termitis]